MITITKPPQTILEIRNTGPRGFSAYEIAKTRGFIGDEDQWLDSLKAGPPKPRQLTRAQLSAQISAASLTFGELIFITGENALAVATSVNAIAIATGTPAPAPAPSPPPPPAPAPAPVLSFASAPVAAEEGNAALFTLNVARNGLTGALTGTYSVSGTGANPADASDFGGSLPSGIWTIAAGSNSTVITITSSEDSAVEPNEDYLVSATHNGVTVSSTGTMSNDDAAPAPSPAISKPVFVRSSPVGSAPFEWTASGDATVYAGDYWRVQTSADGLKDAQGSYLTSIQDITKQISPSEFAPGYTASWTVDAIPPPSEPFLTPGGKFWFHGRVERFTNAGTLASPWCDDVIETINVGTTTMHSATGVNKTQTIVLSNGNRTIGLRAPNESGFVRATKAPASDKTQFEVTLTNIGASGHGFVAVDDNTLSYGPVEWQSPGAGPNKGINLWQSESNGEIRWGDFTQTVLTPGQDGDVVSVTINKITGEVCFYRTRASVTTLLAKRTRALTDWRASIGVSDGASLTINFGQSPMIRPLDAGFAIYG